MWWDSTRESERQYQWPLACTIQKKRKNQIMTLWLWLVCCCLLPTCYFHRWFTFIFCQGKEEASWPDIVWNKNKMHTELWVTRSFPALGLANIPHYEQIVFFNMNMHIIIYSHTYIARQWSIYTHHMHPQHSHKYINTHTHTPGTGLWTTRSEKQ